MESVLLARNSSFLLPSFFFFFFFSRRQIAGEARSEVHFQFQLIKSGGSGGIFFFHFSKNSYTSRYVYGSSRFYSTANFSSTRQPFIAVTIRSNDRLIKIYHLSIADRLNFTSASRYNFAPASLERERERFLFSYFIRHLVSSWRDFFR